MADSWAEAFPRTCKPFLDHLDETLNVKLSAIIASGPHSALTATENAQPAIFAVSNMILRVLEQEFGFRTGERIDVGALNVFQRYWFSCANLEAMTQGP